MTSFMNVPLCKNMNVYLLFTWVLEKTLTGLHLSGRYPGPSHMAQKKWNAVRLENVKNTETEKEKNEQDKKKLKTRKKTRNKN